MQDAIYGLARADTVCIVLIRNAHAASVCRCKLSSILPGVGEQAVPERVADGVGSDRAAGVADKHVIPLVKTRGVLRISPRRLGVGLSCQRALGVCVRLFA